MSDGTYIEIVRSSQPRLSSMGYKSAVMISEVLKKHYENVRLTVLTSQKDMEMMAQRRPDLIFLGMKTVPFKNSLEPMERPINWISNYLSGCRINYTGSKAGAIALDFDKPTAKKVVRQAGFATADYFVAQPDQYRSVKDLPLPFPLFIKPRSAGGGKGIAADSVVQNFTDYQRKVSSIAAHYNSESLVERFLEGREFSVAILGRQGTNNLITMPVELITTKNEQGHRILGQKIKAADTEHVVAIQDEYLKAEIIKLAIDAFRALGARDYGRIDIRLDNFGKPHFLEANLIPGLADHDFVSYFNRACWINHEMSYEDIILKIVELGLSRTQKVFGQFHRLMMPTMA